MWVVTPEQMGRMDRATIDEVGVPSVVLMDRAARGAVEAIVERFDLSPGAAMGILCGAGNNGGDGLAMATMLRHRGFRPVVLVLGEEGGLSADAEVYRQIAGKVLDGVSFAKTEGEVEAWLQGAPDCELWCDALLGTGIDREVGGAFRRAVEFLEEQSAPVVGVDIPSGIDGATGQVLGCAAHCALTVTFGLPKVGQLLDPGRQRCGELRVVDIGIPEAVRESVGVFGETLDEEWLRRTLPTRPQDLHKGGAGRTLHVGGRRGTFGAIVMSARGALVGGAGLVNVASEGALMAGVAGVLPEVMCRAVFGDGQQGEELQEEELRRLTREADVVVVGPGLGLDEVARRALGAVLDEGPQRLVLDADALTLMATDEEISAAVKRCGGGVLTPHPGEMARLLDCSVAEVLADPPAAAREGARRWEAVVVLKTAATVVAAGEEPLGINRTGNAGMATGGMGDALTGLIAVALVEFEGCGRSAACFGVVVHGLAGDAARRKAGVRGVTVTGLLDEVGGIWQALES